MVEVSEGFVLCPLCLVSCVLCLVVPRTAVLNLPLEPRNPDRVPQGFSSSLLHVGITFTPEGAVGTAGQFLPGLGIRSQALLTHNGPACRSRPSAAAHPGPECNGDAANAQALAKHANTNDMGRTEVLPISLCTFTTSLELDVQTVLELPLSIPVDTRRPSKVVAGKLVGDHVVRRRAGRIPKTAALCRR